MTRAFPHKKSSKQQDMLIIMIVGLILVGFAILVLSGHMPLPTPTPTVINILSSKEITLNVTDEAKVSFTVTNNNQSIVEDLLVTCQATTPDGKQTDRIIVEPNKVRIEPLGAGGTSKPYEITIRTSNTPPGKYIILLQVTYEGKPQSNAERIMMHVKH